MMSMKANQNFVRKTTALLSAIAASSFLGLPVLAQSNPNSGDSSIQCVPSSTQSNRSSMSTSSSRTYSSQVGPRTGATPSTTDDLNTTPDSSQASASSRRNTSTSAADDSNTPGVQEYPNQSDPRTGVNSSPNSGATPSTNNDVTAGTTSNPGNQSSIENGVRSGDVPAGNSNTRSRTDTSQSEVNSVNPAGSSTTSSTDQSSSSVSSSTGSNTSMNDAYTPNRSSLAQANATSGAQAGRLLDKGTRDRDNWSSDRVSYGNGQNQGQLPTNGVTSGALTNPTSNQSQVIARCPEGTVPVNQSAPNGMNQGQYQSSPDLNQSSPDRNSIPREQTAPDVQTPGR
ncbi:hypothetical protein K9N68_05645 [Kovacikia minuta CCNUW1]|uniref:hypothetical protein n=1 Tax=Kovacikia minuta TaxID=2931930 RepID=UPI001CC9C49A|nr:hypothetical protein [Kovacikia minuta]UBF27431.1 hypothetical protein K9N68_05645 [Kovacikia minuta CCNUW1]